MLVGFDIDGVLAEIDLASLRIIDNLPQDAKKSAETWYYIERKPLLDARQFLSDDDKMVIITSRPQRVAEITKRWVERYYPGVPLYMVHKDIPKPETNDDQEIKIWCAQKVQLKADKINELGVSVFFEDDTEVMEEFRKACPKCVVVNYGGRCKCP